MVHVANNRGFTSAGCLSAISPKTGRRLRIKIEQGNTLAVLLGSYGQSRGDSGLSHSALL